MKFGILISCLFLLGCNHSQSDGPPEIKYGRDECAHCGMIINDSRFAAALIGEMDGKSVQLKFDDIGDQISYEIEHNSLVVTRRYVCSQQTRKWLKAEQAYYQMSSDLHTPMGSGISATEEKKTELISYQELLLKHAASVKPNNSGN